MTTYWVSTTGNDGGTGAFGDPWLSPQFAFDTATAGDTVNYMNGIYDIGAGIDADTNSGGVGNLIVHQAQNPGNVVWDLTSNGLALDFELVDYVSIVGVEVRGRVAFAVFALVYIHDSAWITFDNCELNDCMQFVVYMDGGPNATFTDCVIHSEGLGDGDGILTATDANDGLTITGCTIYHVGHVGINLRSSDNVTISDCEIYDVASHCVAFSPEPGKSVDNCVIEDCSIHGAGNYGRLTKPHKGIRSRGIGVGTLTIQRNEIHNCDSTGIMIWQSVTGPVFIYNNTIYGNNTDLFNIGEIYLYDDGPGGTPAVTLKNNILFKTRGASHTMRIDVSMSANVTTDYNSFFDSTGNGTVQRDGTNYAFAAYVSGEEANSILDDPTLTAPPGDMTLQAGSPAIDAGVDVDLPFQGTAPDIGAHESGEPGGGGEDPGGGDPGVVHETMSKERQTTDQRFMKLTESAKHWGTCDRARVGAVVAHGPEIVKVGFNGSPSKQPHCDDKGVGHLLVDGHCIRTLHAESNALWLAGRDKTRGATLYVSHFPCWRCAQEIVRAGIARVVYENEYKMDMGVLRLLKSTCIVERFVDGEARDVNIIERQFEVDRFRGLVERQDKGDEVIVRENE